MTAILHHRIQRVASSYHISIRGYPELFVSAAFEDGSTRPAAGKAAGKQYIYIYIYIYTYRYTYQSTRHLYSPPQVKR